MSEADQQFWLKREAEGMRIAKGYLLGYQNGLNVYRPDGVEEIEGQLPFGYHNAEGRNHAADVLGPRLKGVSVSMAEGGEDDGDDEVADELNKQYLILLDEATVKELRGPNGVFADLAFDGAADYAQAVEDMKSGKPPKFDNPSATDKLLTWASWGYESDLRTSFAAAPTPRDTDGRSMVTESTEDWVHIINTLFAAPDEANALQLQAVANRNAVWSERAQNMVALSKAAAGELPGGGLIGEYVDRAVIQPKLDEMFPSDFEMRDVNTSKRGPTMRFMMRMMAAVAAEEVDFSQAPKNEEWLNELGIRKSDIFHDDGTLIPYSEMSDKARRAYYRYITRLLPEWEFNDAKGVVRREALLADLGREDEEDEE